jgi:hypothetical protein
MTTGWGPAGWRCPSSPAALASPGGIGISIEQVPQRLRRPRISSGRRCVRAGDPLDFQQPHGAWNARYLNMFILSRRS